MKNDLEKFAIIAEQPNLDYINNKAKIPYGCNPHYIFKAMKDFVEFLGFINQQLISKKIERLETLMMPANFSSIVGEFMASMLPKYCTSLAKNNYHNGHPDLIPKDMFKNDSVQYTNIGIEIKSSRYLKAWQGHNPEAVFLMVFVFDSNVQRDKILKVLPKPFRFLMVIGAQLEKYDWQFAGRSEESRRTITASVKESGYIKMMKNWIYLHPSFKQKR
jgi:hypothetical protein